MAKKVQKKLKQGGKKEGDLSVGTFEKTYGVKLDAPADMTLRKYLERERLYPLRDVVKERDKRATKK